MERMTAAQISGFCKGKLIGNDAEISGIVRDNREVTGGELFAAICGENFDGHSFVADAEARGAAATLVSRELKEVKIPQIVVEDTVVALGKIAKGYLESLEVKRVCITGSVGKTTTKEMCAAVLSESFKTHKTQGNYNNNIGLPLTVFGLDKSHEAAVFEIGTNHFGEILPLAQIASPDVALITTIGASHLEAFGTKEGVLREKTEIFKGLSENGIAVLNGDDPLLWGMRDKIRYKTIWFGIENPECDVFGEIIKNSIFESRFKVRGGEEFAIACGGEHNIRDALSAICVGRAFGMNDAAIARGLLEFKNTGMRQDVYDFNGVTIIRDCYNANPESMRASLHVLRDFECKGKRICVLGDMRELGDGAEKLHYEMGKVAAECADIVLVTGDFAEAYKRGAGEEKVFVFEDKKAIAEKLSLVATSGDAVLVKGSYGTKMWQVLEYLQGERE